MARLSKFIEICRLVEWYKCQVVDNVWDIEYDKRIVCDVLSWFLGAYF